MITGIYQIINEDKNRRYIGQNHLFYNKTHSKKAIDKIKNTLSEKMSGKDNPNSKVSREDAKEIEQLCNDTDLTQKEIASNYDISRGVVSEISRGVHWTHGGMNVDQQ